MPLDFGLLSMTELRNRPGEVLDRVADDGAAFIIERNGRQKACLVPLSAFFPDIQPTRIADEIEELVQHGEEPRTTFTEARELAFRFPCRLADDTSIEATIFLPHGYPNNCPRVYQSGARWLLDHTRPDSGKKFDLLFRDNVTYGFRRNALGARPLGIVIACSCLSWALVKEHVLFNAGGKLFNWPSLVQLSPAAIASLAVSGIMLLVWLFFFTKTSLRSSAFSFAETLLRTCDTLQ